jgi:uncharacterized membrane protein (UPF0127 family)
MSAKKSFSITIENKPLITNCYFAKSFSQRLFGLIPYKKLEKKEGLLFKGSCQQMHTFFMRFPIEIVFLNKDKKILHIAHLKPWRISPWISKAYFALELAQGMQEKHQLSVGKTLEFQL